MPLSNNDQIVPRNDDPPMDWWALATLMGERALALLRDHAIAEADRILVDEFMPALRQYGEDAQQNIADYITEITAQERANPHNIFNNQNQGESLFNLQ
jgi:hypothetical protein